MLNRQGKPNTNLYQLFMPATSSQVVIILVHCKKVIQLQSHSVPIPSLPKPSYTHSSDSKFEKVKPPKIRNKRPGPLQVCSPRPLHPLPGARSNASCALSGALVVRSLLGWKRAPLCSGQAARLFLGEGLGRISNINGHWGGERERSGVTECRSLRLKEPS